MALDAWWWWQANPNEPSLELYHTGGSGDSKRLEKLLGSNLKVVLKKCKNNPLTSNVFFSMIYFRNNVRFHFLPGTATHVGRFAKSAGEGYICGTLHYLSSVEFSLCTIFVLNSNYSTALPNQQPYRIMEIICSSNFRQRSSSIWK